MLISKHGKKPKKSTNFHVFLSFSEKEIVKLRDFSTGKKTLY
jgi:hypothetical protein